MAHPRGRHAGSSTYSAGLMEATAGCGVSITLATFGKGDTPAGITVERLRTGKRPRILSLFSPLPASAWALGSEAAKARLKRLLSEKRWSAVVIDHAASAWALPMISAQKLPVVYIAHNHEASVRPAVAALATPLWRRLLLLRDAAKFARLEQELLESADLITAITAEDTASFQTSVPGKRVLTLLPGYRDMPVSVAEITEATPRRIALVGRYDWIAKQANLVNWARHAVPVLYREGIETEVIGHVPPSLRQRIDMPGLRFQGEVADLGPALARSRIGLVAEEQGGGFKMKTLDYIFHGLPVAALSGTLSGQPEAVRAATLQADSMTTLAETIAQTIDDLMLLNRLKREALEAAHDAFHWESRGAQFADALNELRLHRGRTSR
jgi:polysaccharide biosynthesis protein PslH